MNEINSSQTFSLTPSAGARITTLLTSEAAPYFRVSVDGGGCSGFQYKFDFEHNRTDDDILFRQHGVDILVDDISLGFLENAQLDYVEELVGSFFRIENPNATASCGCGTSFSV